MKRSELEHRLKAVILGAMGGPENPETLARVEAAAQALAPLSCVKWDPEEPEPPQVWKSGAMRLLADGTWQIDSPGVGWQPMVVGTLTRAVYDELKDRLLSEYEEAVESLAAEQR